MKSQLKKNHRNFKLSPDVDAELRRRSELVNVSQTQIIEDALRHYFAGAMQKVMQENLSKALNRMKGKMVRGRGFEPLTPTVSR